MRAIAFGQSGVGKTDVLRVVQSIARDEGKSIELLNVGEWMQTLDHEGRDPQLFPSLPVTERITLHRATLEAILERIEQAPDTHYILNTHSVFRTTRGFVGTADFRLLRRFAPDVILVFIDDFFLVHRRLAGTAFANTKLSAVLEWRAVETAVAQIVANSILPAVGEREESDKQRFFVVARSSPPATVFRLLFERGKRLRIYPSFAITGASADDTRTINTFKESIEADHVVFDPYRICERGAIGACMAQLENLAETVRAADTIHAAYGELVRSIRPFLQERSVLNLREEFVPTEVLPGICEVLFDPKPFCAGRPDELPERLLEPFVFRLEDLVALQATIDGQIQSRDYLLIDQSELVCAYVLWDNVARQYRISAGSQSELTYAKMRGRMTMAVSEGPRSRLSPWIAELVDDYSTSLKELADKLAKRYDTKRNQGGED